MGSFALPQRHSTLNPHHNTLARPAWPTDDSVDGNLNFEALALQRPRPFQVSVLFTEINSRGVATGGHAMTREQFCYEKGLQVRDMRSIDSDLYAPSITAKGRNLFLNMSRFRAVITPDSMIIFDGQPSCYEAQGNSTAPNITHDSFVVDPTEFKSVFIERLTNIRSPVQESWMRPPYYLHFDTGSFTLIALGSFLESLLVSLEEELKYLRSSILTILRELQQRIRTKPLKQLLLHTYQLKSFIGKCSNIQNSFDLIAHKSRSALLNRKTHNLLEGDVANQTAEVMEQETLERLLEAYSLERFIEEGKIILMHIRVTEELVALTISSNQVFFVSLDLKLAIASVGLGVGALITGIFGMNLKSDVEEEDWVFAIVTGVIALLATAVIFVGWRQLEKTLQKSSNVQAHLKPKKIKKPARILSSLKNVAGLQVIDLEKSSHAEELHDAKVRS
ncbi:hypothetical protein O181_037203 [Austropuccinia psidii MF-1]|uniref:Magnesium transporter n=1 Tax=Austropuccinia psidii MF-1 TaxID=1389203 RepID=A0A9Q3DAY5_9BASI|nr:hypothetical protein [Austropuccinia psidii MF-1]